MRTLGIALLLGLLFTDPAASMEAARQASQIWAGAVLPALFPFLTLSLLLVAGRGAGAGRGWKELALTALLGALGGSPGGARLIGAKWEQGSLSPRQAQCLAACCTTCSPMFILGTLAGFLGEPGWGGIMLTAHWLGAALTGLACLCWTRAWPMEEPGAGQGIGRGAPITLGEAVSQAALAMLNVCGCMILFNVVVARVLGLLPLSQIQGAALGTLLEMAGGTARIASLGLEPIPCAALLCGAVSFGGLSVFTQNAAFLRKAGVRIPTQLAARGLHGVLSYGICRGLGAESFSQGLGCFALVILILGLASLWQTKQIQSPQISPASRVSAKDPSLAPAVRVSS